jgi:predicted metal-dependent peptidase
MRRILGWKDFRLFEQVYLDKEDPKGNKISEEAFKKMRLCCFDIMGKYPFFRKLLSDLTIRENRYLPYKTMATDGVSIHYDPGFVLAKSEAEIIFVICHEIMHNVLFHFARKMPDPELWNVAADYALNQLLEGVGEMPKEALYPGCGYHPDDKKFVNLSAEQIYEWLVKSGSKPPEQPDPGDDQKDAEIVIGDIIRDTKTNNYGIVRSIDPTTGEIDYDIIPKSEVSKYL